MSKYEEVELALVFSMIRNGASIKQGHSDEGYPITRIETISSGDLDRNKMGYAGIVDLSKYRSYLLQTGDILMSHINSEKHLGKTAYYEQTADEQIIHGMNLLCLRPVERLIGYKFAYWFFQSNAFKRQIPGITKKSVNQASFTVTALKQLRMPKPSLPEQKRITEILDDAAEVLFLRKRQLEHLERLIASAFHELFGDVRENGKAWDVLSGAEAFTFSSGKFNPSGNLDDSYPYPCYGGNGITGMSKEYLIDYKTLVIGRVGAYCGSVHMTGDKSWITDNAIYLKQYDLSRYDLEFLKVLFKELNFNRFADFSGQPKITQKPLLSLSYICPPLELQRRFAGIVNQIEDQKAAVRQAIAQAELLFDSLMSRYFG